VNVRRSVSGVSRSDSGVSNGGLVCGAPNERLDSVLMLSVHGGVCRVRYVILYRLAKEDSVWLPGSKNIDGCVDPPLLPINGDQRGASTSIQQPIMHHIISATVCSVVMSAASVWIVLARMDVSV
jgi:hypothetical protein